MAIDGLLLLVDEAHTLSWRLLEEIRMLTNLVRDGQPRVRVVLAGGSLLEERFASPRMSSFSQRLAARCYLESLDSVETGQYVRAQIESVGGDPRLFTDDALRSVYRATDGIPRLINQVCDHALILASLGDRTSITSDAIEEAWSDLQQLPPPWTAGKATGRSGRRGRVRRAGRPDRRSPLGHSLSAAPQPLVLAVEADAEADVVADEQWRIIEDHLAQIEEDFEPAGSIGTEVELDFPEFGNPFAEDFADEEVLLERYAADSETFASRAPRDQPRLRLEHPAQPARSRSVQRRGASSLAHQLRGTHRHRLVANRRLPTPAAPSSARLTFERLDGPGGRRVDRDRRRRAGPVWTTPHARKLEYRQLFARLRRS